MSNPTLYTGALKTVRPRKETKLSPRGAQAERHYSIPESQQDSARSWIEEGAEVVCNSKPAAIVIFVRDGSNGVETYMTYRYKSPMGRVAFPGGLAIYDDANMQPWVGPSETQWAEKFGEHNPKTARAAVTAAIREVFEETGLLLAGVDDTSTVETLNTHENMSSRVAIASQSKDFNDFLSKRNLKLRADLLKPIARWQSPDYFHKRYDVHYFAAAVPVGQNPTLLEGKGIWGQWLSAQELLDHRATTELGDAIGQPDTVGKTVEELVNPGVLCVLESIAKAPSAIAFLSKKRVIDLKKPETKMAANGKCYLSFSEPGVQDARATRTFPATAAVVPSE